MSATRVFAEQGSSCWTCRLRRKKCDRNHPTCQTCAALRITCHFSEGKPEWMDGGPKQDAMALQLKREVKQGAPWRRVDGRRMFVAPWHHVEDQSKPVSMLPEQRAELEWVMLSSDETGPVSTLSEEPTISSTSDLSTPGTSPRNEPFPSLDPIASSGAPLTQADTVLVMFYLQNVIPFLFPFYRPANLEGGISWKLDMMLRSPVFRQTALCQGAFFFCLAKGGSQRPKICQTVFKKVEEALECLSLASRAISCRPSIEDDLHNAVHLMTSMVQVMRFEMATLTFRNCHMHLNAAIGLFGQILHTSKEPSQCDPRGRFLAVMESLGPQNAITPAENIMLPSAEQSAFEFATALLIFDDVMASISLQRTPHLHHWHHALLGHDESRGPVIDLARIIGCPNWVLLGLGEISALDEWKRNTCQTGTFNMLELVQRAMPIKDRLESRLHQEDYSDHHSDHGDKHLLGLLGLDKKPHSTARLVASIWAHATLAYLHTVLSGWQPANAEIQHHIRQLMGSMTQSSFPPDIIRVVVWPFCVAGCLADASLEPQFRDMASAIQPRIVFGTTRKAFELIEQVWSSRSNFTGQDLAACFRFQDEVVFLA